jgi:thiamine pyrophosphate-dependent acetolactate synthase large subunit-like protein
MMLDRREVVATLLRPRVDCIVVSGLGAPSYDVAAAGGSDRDFPLWGGMGGAAMVGLGLALAQPALPVLVITGDGEQLMGLGAFATIAVQAPPNLVIVVLDNGLYGETGGQPSHTRLGVDLAAVAASCGIPEVRLLRSMDEVEDFAPRAHRVGEGPAVVVVPVDPADLPRIMPPRDGHALRLRVQQAIGTLPE